MSNNEPVKNVLSKQIDRLKSKQENDKTKGKACAITKIEEAILWLKYDK